MIKYINVALAKAEFTGNFQDSYPPGQIKAMLDEVPAADVREVKYGAWIEEAFKMICPFCDTYFSTINTPINLFKGYYHFCPNCGAYMRGETE